MPNFTIKLEKETCQKLEQMLASAQKLGDLRMIKRILTIFSVCEGERYSTIASILNVSRESIRLWVRNFLLKGPDGLRAKKSPGRRPKLTKTQKEELYQIIVEGPEKAGYFAACWRSPMIQDLIYNKFGVFYSVFYISQLLKNMGFSYQKARFVSDHLDEKKREEWVKDKWPKICNLAIEKNAYILFGDEASFPQWGTLSYTWAIRGQQPTIKTSGKRKSYKVFGLIDYFTGQFFYKGHEGKLNSENYIEFLNEVLAKTNRHIILIQDGAKYHTSKAVNNFFEKQKNRLTVFQLPSYSPDYNPIEKLWKKIKEKGTHLKYFPTFQELKNKVQETLILFDNTPEEVLSIFGFYEEKNAA